MNFGKLTQYIDSLKDKYDIPACDLVVSYNSQIVYRHMAGHSDLAKSKKVSENDLYFLYSATKVITCTAALRLIDKGLMKLEDKVCIYLPEFSNMLVSDESGTYASEKNMTIKDLFTMCAGLTYNLNSDNIQKVKKTLGDSATTRDIVRAIAKDHLIFEPSTHFNYSLCHDVLGAVIEVVSGMSLGEYFNENIFKPLGMYNTTFKITPEVLNRISQQYYYDNNLRKSIPMDKTNEYIITPSYESGGAGLVSCPNDYIKFAQALSNYGVSKDGYKVLSKDAVDLMRKNHLDSVCQKDFETKCNKVGYGYGLGVRTLIEKEKSGAKSPIGEFGWDGAAGAYTFIDPENNIAAFYIHHIRNCNVGYDVIHPTIRDLVYEIIL